MSAVFFTDLTSVLRPRLCTHGGIFARVVLVYVYLHDCVFVSRACVHVWVCACATETRTDIIADALNFNVRCVTYSCEDRFNLNHIFFHQNNLLSLSLSLLSRVLC
jgi:hypothetical protein